MARCPECNYPLPDDREYLGSRCPGCHDPLYEARAVPRRARAGDATCVVHPDNEASGPCQRCGNDLCEVCRSRWRDQILCIACMDHALTSGEGTEPAATLHARLSAWSAGLGAGAWGLGIVAWFLSERLSASQNSWTAFLLLLTIALSGLFGLFGVGHAMTALLQGGRHVVVAITGLFISGLLLAVIVARLAVSVWIV